MPKKVKHKVKQKIHFKGYHELVKNSLENTANQINNLLDPTIPIEVGKRLKMYSVNDFLKFSKNHYFKKEGKYSNEYCGYLNVKWKLQKKTSVYIRFKGKGIVEIDIVTDDTIISERTNTKQILEVFARYNVPVR